MRIIKNICYGEIEYASKKLDIYLPEKTEFSVFLYFHGGGLEGGDKSDGEQFATYLTDRNIAVVSANYRLYPEAVYPQFIRDAARAAAWTLKHMGDYGKCDKFYVGGSSAGGYLSMMLCFDEQYLLPYGIKPNDIAGYIHDAGQPTCHFNVLRERGIDTRRVIVDETAPLFHIGTQEAYAPMLFVISDNDMENRYEQTMLAVSTLHHFGHGNCSLKVMHGDHCQYVYEKDENGDSVFGKIIYEFLQKID